MTEPADTPASPAASPRRSFLRLLFSAQESGLVLVILLMMLALTLFGGTKQVTERVSIPEGASVVVYDTGGEAHEPGTIPARLVDRYVVTDASGGETVYPNAWRYAEPSGSPALFTDVEKNKFFEKRNLIQIARDASFFAVMAVGMTAVIILAGIDLSVGSIYALAAIIGAIALNKLGEDASGVSAVIVGLLVCVGVGGVCGLANGAMTVGLRVHPFVITLGMMAALRGLTIIIPQKIYGEQSITGFADGFTSGFFKLQVAEVYPVPPIIMLLVALVGWFVLTRTVFGRRVFAIGGNETAAQYAGIPVGRVKIWVYTLMGALAGLSACMYIGYYGSAETGAGMAYELQVIAAAVIGGASLMGGRGSALGAVLGAIVIKLIDNAMIIFEIDQSWNQVVMGAAIIVAVVVDQAKRRISGA
jgi:ribose transport system permease protein